MCRTNETEHQPELLRICTVRRKRIGSNTFDAKRKQFCQSVFVKLSKYNAREVVALEHLM